MIIGVPREIKPGEHRVAITPVGVRELIGRGHRVVIETRAGEGSTIHDVEYEDQGGEIAASARDVFEIAELILKVKELQPPEVAMLHAEQVLFTYLHLAAHPDLTARMLDRDVIGIAYETVELPGGALPLLAPMSEVAGRMATQAGAYFLEKAHGGRGVLLGGVPGVMPAKVVIIGAGMAGTNAAMMAAGLGARVIVLDTDAAKLQALDALYRGRILTLSSNMLTIEEQVRDADLVIGAVLLPGASAPKLVTETMVKEMKRGSVLVDIAIDQGGCFETSRETTHHDPTYVLHEVVHYAVGNIPGAVPHTSTYALTNATLPYVLALADGGVSGAVARRPELLLGLNIIGSAIVHRAVAKSLGLEYADPTQILDHWPN
ncbi:MAG TPA: alanine dehydrogenase [Actinobacteria bacterium]|nr:alanine dehydrogenase [bacterium BMS3Bbin01]HDH25109.1 alanine dehydrogenase [Actinomycetota bacterium]